MTSKLHLFSTSSAESNSDMFFSQLAATNSISLVNAMQFVRNPWQLCHRVHEMIREITARVRCLKGELKSRGEINTIVCQSVDFLDQGVGLDIIIFCYIIIVNFVVFHLL